MTNEIQRVNNTVEKNNKRINFLWLIFLVVTLNTMLNLCFVFGWVDKIWGNGGKTPNGYTIPYWFTHISYITSCLVIIWSGYELVCHYYLKKEVSSIFRYYTIVWITIVMVCFMPQWPLFFKDTWKHWFTDSPVPDDWIGVKEANRVIYELIDIFQVTVMHFVVAIMCIVFYAKHDGKTEKINKTQIQSFSIMSIVFMLSYFGYCIIATHNGVKEPYPILNWNPDDTTRWPLYVQFICCVGFAALYYLINIPVLRYLMRRNSSPVINNNEKGLREH